MNRIKIIKRNINIRKELKETKFIKCIKRKETVNKYKNAKVKIRIFVTNEEIVKSMKSKKKKRKIIKSLKNKKVKWKTKSNCRKIKKRRKEKL